MKPTFSDPPFPKISYLRSSFVYLHAFESYSILIAWKPSLNIFSAPRSGELNLQSNFHTHYVHITKIPKKSVYPDNRYWFAKKWNLLYEQHPLYDQCELCRIVLHSKCALRHVSPLVFCKKQNTTPHWLVPNSCIIYMWKNSALISKPLIRQSFDRLPSPPAKNSYFWYMCAWAQDTLIWN